MTNLPVLNPTTGEVGSVVDADSLLAIAGRMIGLPDVREGTIADLAAFTEDAQHLERIAKEARGLAGDVIVQKLDRDSTWTCHEGEYTITCPSPQAGTVGWHGECLHIILTALVDAGAVSQAAMDAAVKDVTPRPTVSYAFLRDLRDLLDGNVDEPEFEQLLDEVMGLLASQPEPVYAAQVAGVNRLLKRGGEIEEAVRWAQIPLLPPRRVAKVKRERAA